MKYEILFGESGQSYMNIHWFDPLFGWIFLNVFPYTSLVVKLIVSRF